MALIVSSETENQTCPRRSNFVLSPNISDSSAPSGDFLNQRASCVLRALLPPQTHFFLTIRDAFWSHNIRSVDRSEITGISEQYIADIPSNIRSAISQTRHRQSATVTLAQTWADPGGCQGCQNRPSGCQNWVWHPPFAPQSCIAICSSCRDSQTLAPLLAPPFGNGWIRLCPH